MLLELHVGSMTELHRASEPAVLGSFPRLDPVSTLLHSPRSFMFVIVTCEPRGPSPGCLAASTEWSLGHRKVHDILGFRSKCSVPGSPCRHTYFKQASAATAESVKKVRMRVLMSFLGKRFVVTMIFREFQGQSGPASSALQISACNPSYGIRPGLKGCQLVSAQSAPSRCMESHRDPRDLLEIADQCWTRDTAVFGNPQGTQVQVWR